MRVPGILVWPGMIEADRASRRPLQLQRTSSRRCSRSPAPTDAVPDDRFIDGVDQTSFLLAPDGSSNRKYHYYWLGSTMFSALRVGEYKFMIASISDDDRDVRNPGGFTGVDAEVPLRPALQPLPRPEGDAQLPDPQARLPRGVPERHPQPPAHVQQVPAEERDGRPELTGACRVRP